MCTQRTVYQPALPRRLVKIFSIIVLLTCLRVWVGPVSMLDEAQAQIPDSALQRKLLLEEARQTNRLLTEIKQLLRKGTLNVRIQGADN